jgi:hypothetical protein
MVDNTVNSSQVYVFSAPPCCSSEGELENVRFALELDSDVMQKKGISKAVFRRNL